ncbi:cytochrome P450 [Schizophyllum commune Tattone D]|nr:cytochrome P450 [Schizophyllum commune Tattone D]
MLDAITRSLPSGYLLTPFILAFVSLCCIRLWRRLVANKNSRGRIPGPRPLPFIGNLFDLPLENEARAYNRLSAQYAGDLVWLQVFGRGLLVVNSYEHAVELFEKRSAKYSSRAHSVMLNDLMGFDWVLGLMPYGERWRRHRRVFRQQFGPPAAKALWPTQLSEAHALLRRLLATPSSESLDENLRHNAASVIMNVIYGISLEDEDDRYVRFAERALDGMAQAARPGAFFVDVIPWLRYVPQWLLPGGGFQKKARVWKENVTAMRDAPFDHVLGNMRRGTAKFSFVTCQLKDLDTSQMNPSDIGTIKACAGMAYLAGAESTVSMIKSFFLAMVAFPDVLQRAREEIDSVVSPTRLPDFCDRDALPYISALVQELLRWAPIAPLGLPHMTSEDDVYNGCFIPAGTIVMGNTWSILNDPTRYPEPRQFRPERFLPSFPGENLTRVLAPLSTAWGYGRRTCAGMALGETQVWITVASILSVFDIRPITDNTGRPIAVEPEFTSGMISHPTPFSYALRPRDDVAARLIGSVDEQQ